MNMPREILEILPEDAAEKIRAAWKNSAGNTRELSVSLAGSFSTGKTSLLNAMLGEKLLPTALAESTTLPTFVSFGDKENWQLVLENETRPLSREESAGVIVSPPEGARFFDVQLPLSWLRGVEIIDLPGTGGMDERRRAYGREAMRQADAVIYLLPPRGPSRSDLEELYSLHRLGKPVFLALAQWDIVQESVQRGEDAPDLKEWRQRIYHETGLDLPVVPVDKNGTGVAEILAFLSASAQNLHGIREEAFKNSACAILEAEAEHCKRELDSLAEKSEAQKAEAHAGFIVAREKLLKLRMRAHEEQRTETENALENWEKYAQNQERQLADKLREQAEACAQPEDFQKFVEECGEILRKQTEQAASYAQHLAEKYGKFHIEPQEMRELKLALLPPEKTSASDFLDLAKLEHLRSRLEELNALQENDSGNALAQAGEEIKEAKDAISGLEAEYSRLRSMPAPQYEEVVEPDGKGRILGRLLGEVADMALLVFAPATIATKTGAMAGKAAKMAGMSAKMAATVGKTCANAARGAAQMHRAAKGRGAMPMRFADKIQKLEYITLAYWGEKLGTMLDGQPVTRMRVDKEACAQQDAALREIEERIRQQKLRLYDLEKGALSSSEDSENLRAKKAALQAEIDSMQKEAEEKSIEAQARSQADVEASLNYEKTKAITAWKRHFNMQLRPMRDLLASLIQNWWLGSLQESLQERERQVEELLANLKSLPEQKKEKQQSIGQRLAALEKAAALLQCGN